MAMATPKSYPTAAFVLTLIGAIFIILGGIYTAAVYAWLGSAVISILPGLGALLIGLAVAALLFGIIILVGALMMRSNPQSARTWGIIVLILSILSLVGGGGFFIGFLLALIGGILAIIYHPPATQAAWGQQPTPPAMTPPGWSGGQAAGAAPGQKFCPSCGSPNPAGSATCAKCGAPLTG